MTSQRMTALEAAFVELDTRGAPFVYAAILELDRQIELAALRRHLGDALASEPRYHQRMTRGPLGRHAWANDDDFRIERHVRAITAPPPGGPHQVEALAASMLGADLPRDHAPWQVSTVQGLANGRGALIAVVHHALVNGLAGIRLLEHVFGIGEASAPPRARRPRRRAALRRLARPGVIAAPACACCAAACRRPRSSASTRATPVARAASRACRSRATSWSTIQHALGATTNDVVLATVAGALRRFAARRGIEVDEARDVRAMVPVGRHAGNPSARSGNRIALLLAPLPIDLADPVASLTRIATATHALKHGEDANAGDLLVAIAEATSPRVLAGVLRLAVEDAGVQRRRRGSARPSRYRCSARTSRGSCRS